MSSFIHQILRQIPGLSSLYNRLDAYEKHSQIKPGHFYSPVPDTEALRQDAERIWSNDLPAALAGIDLRTTEQLQLLHSFEAFLSEYPFSATATEGLRYHFDNRYYAYTDGMVLYCMLRHLQPIRLVEAGSGFSSALMLDVHDRFGSPKSMVFIDPDMSRLDSLLKSDDRSHAQVLAKPVQQVPIETFTRMEAGDILFIDSSHVCKTGSDVNFLFFEVLPVIRPGVVIHIHDVFYPFEYPQDWVLGGLHWNEAYLLRSLLSDSSRYQILFWTDYLQRMYPQDLEPIMKHYSTGKTRGQSIWLQVAG